MTFSPSQHSQTQGSSWAVSIQQWLLRQPKKDETTHQILFSADMSTPLPWIILPHLLQCLCVHLPPMLNSGLSALCSESVFLWLVHDVTRDTPEAKDSSTKNPLLCRKCRYRSTYTNTPASLHWQNNAQHCQQSLTVQQVIHALPGLPWPSPQHDDIHPLVLLWRPRVPANSKLSLRNLNINTPVHRYLKCSVLLNTPYISPFSWWTDCRSCVRPTLFCLRGHTICHSVSNAMMEVGRVSVQLTGGVGVFVKDIDWLRQSVGR